MSSRVETIEPGIGGMRRTVPHDADCGRTMHCTTIMGSERPGVPLASVQAA